MDVNRVVPPIDEVLSNLRWDANDDARVLDLFGDVFDKLRKARLTNVYTEKEINKIILSTITPTTLRTEKTRRL